MAIPFVEFYTEFYTALNEIINGVMGRCQKVMKSDLQSPNLSDFFH